MLVWSVLIRPILGCLYRLLLVKGFSKMGYLQSLGFKHEVNDGLSLEIAIKWHLEYNHYPGLPAVLVPACIAAIEAANMGEWDSIVSMPDEVLFRGSGSAQAFQIIESCHLDAFVDDDEGAW